MLFARRKTDRGVTTVFRYVYQPAAILAMDLWVAGTVSSDHHPLYDDDAQEREACFYSLAKSSPGEEED